MSVTAFLENKSFILLVETAPKCILLDKAINTLICENLLYIVHFYFITSKKERSHNRMNNSVILLSFLSTFPYIIFLSNIYSPSI